MTKDTKRAKASRRPHSLMPTPNGEGFRTLLGGEPDAPMSMQEAEAEITRAIEAGRKKDGTD